VSSRTAFDRLLEDSRGTPPAGQAERLESGEYAPLCPRYSATGAVCLQIAAVTKQLVGDAGSDRQACRGSGRGRVYHVKHAAAPLE
jgi:hypothetical protein